jgi:protein phosphatase
VREKNEDYLAFWQPDDEAERLQRGAVAVVADGVGGLQSGEVASKMAVEIAIATFQRMNPANSPKQILKQIFDTANLEIYEAGMSDPNGGRGGLMATTLSVCIFRDRELFIGHVGDTRVYLVRQETNASAHQ